MINWLNTFMITDDACPSRMHPNRLQPSQTMQPRTSTQFTHTQTPCLCLREPVTVVTTGQEQCNAPEPLAGTTWSIEPPSPEQRDRILASHGADASDSAFALFRQPLELALAAKLHGTLPARAGTGILLDAYVRMRLSLTAVPAATRAVLRAWARAMDQQLRSNLSLGEAERLASRVDGADMHDALACRLVEIEGQHLAFAHERFQRLLAAEAIVLDHLDDPTVLARELQAPFRADLVALAATFAPDIEAVQAIMEAAPESNMFIDALQGRLGPVPEQFMDWEARRLLSHATRVMATCSLHFETDFQLAITPPSTWSSYEAAVFAAVGTVLHDGVLLRETMLLLDATDTTLASATATEPETIAHHIGTALVGTFRTDSGVLPASLILEACRLTFNRFDSTVTAQQFARLSHGLDPTRYSRIYLVLLLASRTRLFDSATYILLAAKCAWESGAYHLQLAIFDTLMFLRHNVSPSERVAIEDFLQDLQPRHPFLADALTECLVAYDLISLPFTAEDIATEIEQVLGAPDTAETIAAAYHVYVNQLEPVIGPPFAEAIEALEPAERTRLAALAGRHTEALVWKEVILKELLEASDPVAIPAFKLWAASLSENTMQPQDDVAAYVISVLGLASHMHPLPPLASLSGPTGEAWASYGQILWHMHHPGLTSEEIADRCRPQWQRLLHGLNDNAAEPLFWISDTYQTPVGHALHSLLDRFPEETRDILESGIARPEQQLQLTRWPNQLAHVRRYIQLLTRGGNHVSQRLLASMAHDPDLGHDAATAARQLSDRLGINAADDQ